MADREYGRGRDRGRGWEQGPAWERDQDDRGWWDRTKDAVQRTFEGDEERGRGEWDRPRGERYRNDWGTRSDWDRNRNEFNRETWRSRDRDRSWDRDERGFENRGYGAEWGRGRENWAGHGAWPASREESGTFMGRQHQDDREAGFERHAGTRYGWVRAGDWDRSREGAEEPVSARDWNMTSGGMGFSHAGTMGGLASHSAGRFAGRGPKNYRRSDDRIAEDVNDRLTRHPDVDASEVECHVKDGVVTLSGTVDSRRTRRLAEEIIEDISGVRDVENHLKVSEHHTLGERTLI
jgi:hypothetical protein